MDEHIFDVSTFARTDGNHRILLVLKFIPGLLLKEMNITKENFAVIACQKIIRILSFPGNDSSRAWALKFLQRASRGFSTCQHEPWIDSLGTVESSIIILSNCSVAVPKLDLFSPTMNSTLSFVVNSPRQFNPFISALATQFMRHIEESRQMFSVHYEPYVKEGIGRDSNFNAIVPDVGTCDSPTERCFDINSENEIGKICARNLSDCSPNKKRRKSESQSLRTNESIHFLKQVWGWAKTGCIELDPVLLGDILSHLPECIEEVVISWTKEELSSNRRRNGIDDINNILPTENAGAKDTIPCDDDMLHSLSILQESSVFLAAASSSPKLFQISSSMLNQLLIQTSECSCNFTPLLSLSKTFAHETAKGRVEFYPLQVQPLILLMDVDPNSLSSNEQREIISSQITNMSRGLPSEAMISLVSHFPAWLPFLNFTTLLSLHVYE